MKPMTIAGGALTGAVWGVAARLWMRSIATDPQFTWSGTAYIVAVPTIVGLCMGIVRSSRAPKVSRFFGVASAVLLGMGAGMLMLPTVLLGSVANARRRWHAVFRILLAALAAVPVLAVLSETSSLPLVRRTAAMLVYGVLCFAMIRMVSVSLQSRPDSHGGLATAPRATTRRVVRRSPLSAVASGTPIEGRLR